MSIIILNPDEATSGEINLKQRMPYQLVATYKDTGKPIPGATLADVQFNSSQPIGDFTPGSDPDSAFFVPKSAGVTEISGQAQINGIKII